MPVDGERRRAFLVLDRQDGGAGSQVALSSLAALDGTRSVVSIELPDGGARRPRRGPGLGAR